MADSYKRLGALAPSDSSNHVLYTAPSDKSTLISNITITNRSFSAQNFTLSLSPTTVLESTLAGGALIPIKTKIYSSAIISGYSFEVLEPGIIMPPGATLIVSGTSSLTFSVSGTEIDYPNNYNILGQTYGIGNNYTVPLGKQTLVRSINLTNNDASDCLFSLALHNSLVSVPKFVVVSQQSTGLPISSTDSVTWTQGTMPVTNWSSVCYGQGKFVAVGSNTGSAAYSIDGNMWTSSTLPASLDWYSVVYGNGYFVSVKLNSTIAASSTDGITWSSGVLPSSSSWKIVGYGNGVFVAASSSNSIAATSTDGTTWTQRTLPATASGWNAITYGNGTFVVLTVLGTNVAATSTDGTTWTQRTMSSNNNWSSISYGAGKFVAIAKGSTISGTNVAATSTDGITWTNTTMPTTATWNAISYGNNIFVAVAAYYSISAASSTDGITWTYRTTPTVSQYWSSIAFGTANEIDSIDYIAYSSSIKANETITVKGGFTLESSRNIYLNATGNVSINTFGMEM